MAEVFFFLAAIGAIAGAVGTVSLRNPFYSVLALVCHLLSLAALFLLLRAEFVAAAQVVVYAGAVMVLYVFVVAYVGDQGPQLSGGGSGNAALALVGKLQAPFGGSQEARVGLQRNACAAGGVQGQQARSCAGRRLFNINIRFKGKDIRKLTVKVKGKKQKVLRMKPRPRVRIDLRKYRKGRVVVQITIVTKAGKKLTGTRVYHPCTKKRPGRGFRF